MALEHEPKPLEYVRKGPASAFAEYSRAERQRRANSEETFNAELYDEAVQFVLDTLQKHGEIQSE